MKKDKTNKNLYFLFLAVYWAFACYTPFLLLYLQDRKLSYIQIGTIFALNSAINVVFQPVWGYLTDKYISIRKALYITITLSAAAIFMFIPARNFFAVVIATILFASFQSGILPLMDSLCYKIIHKYNNIKYGRVRLMGSAGYAISSFLLGIIIARTSIDTAFYLYSIISILLIMLLRKLDYSDDMQEMEKSQAKPLKILSDKVVLLFLLSVTIGSISYGANNSYIGVLLQETGGNVENLGLLWFVVAMSEIPMFFVINRLISKIGSLNTYLLSLTLFSARFLLCTLWKNTMLIIMIQFLQGFTFPLFMAGGLDYLCGLVPAEARSFSISLMSALIFGLGSLIGNLGGGIIIDSLNVFNLYRIMSIISFSSLLTALLLKKKRGSKASPL